MWRIDGNSFVERETAAECERGQWGRRGSEIAETRRGIILSVTIPGRKKRSDFELSRLRGSHG